MLAILKKIGKGLAWIIGVMAVVIFVGWQCWEWYYYRTYYASQKFDQEKWKETKKRWKNETLSDVLYGTINRCKMYDDLVKNHLKKGMTLKEVEELLGEEKPDVYCVDKKIKCSTYHMGTCYASALTWSSDFLEICFNDKEKVIGFGREGFYEDVCENKFFWCPSDEEKCKYFMKKDQAMGEKCTFEVNRW
jgi:hypothetical protein